MIEDADIDVLAVRDAADDPVGRVELRRAQP
jgi:hypothetical protein